MSLGDAPVVVTGAGVVSPIGVGFESFADGLMAGRSGGRVIDRYDTTEHRSRICCPADDFDPLVWLTPRDAKRMDRAAQMAIAAATMAAEDAGILDAGASASDGGRVSRLDPGRVDPLRVGVVTGCCAPMEWVWRAHVACFTKGPRTVPPTTVLATYPDASGARISIALGSHGPCQTVSTACASGADAIGWARLMLRAGWADVVIAGGVEAPITPSATIAFGQARSLSTRNDDPAHASRPFDADRDGFVMGEGAGLVVLEREADARARGARIRGRIAGYAANADAHHMTQPEPDAEWQAAAITDALRDAGIAPADLDYVNAHGTSTPLNDPTETRALRRALGAHAEQVPISSTKSMTGHGLGAAGGLEVCAVLACMERGQVHPTINLDRPDPACDLDYTPGVARARPIRWALSESFGFGGKNAALVIAAP